MTNEEIKSFVQAANFIIIRDILEVNILIPTLIFDYSIDPYIRNGYYMYQNISGTTITLNMNLISSLKNDDDIKTVITYGFIHEIYHMHQEIYSNYRTNQEYYSFIEDNADRETINFIRNNIPLINNRLNFKFNDIFLIGIERQLHSKSKKINLNIHAYIAKIIAGTLYDKLNYNFDYLYNLLITANTLVVVFPDKRKYYIDLDYEQGDSIGLLVNLLIIINYKIIYIDFINQIDDYKVKELTLKLY